VLGIRQGYSRGNVRVLLTQTLHVPVDLWSGIGPDHVESPDLGKSLESDGGIRLIRA